MLRLKNTWDCVGEGTYTNLLIKNYHRYINTPILKGEANLKIIMELMNRAIEKYIVVFFWGYTPSIFLWYY